MNPIETPGWTRRIGAPSGMTEDQVGTLYIREEVCELGDGRARFLVSGWRPSESDLATLNAGGYLALGICDQNHPVVYLAALPADIMTNGDPLPPHLNEPRANEAGAGFIEELQRHAARTYEMQEGDPTTATPVEVRLCVWSTVALGRVHVLLANDQTFIVCRREDLEETGLLRRAQAINAINKIGPWRVWDFDSALDSEVTAAVKDDLARVVRIKWLKGDRIDPVLVNALSEHETKPQPIETPDAKPLETQEPPPHDTKPEPPAEKKAERSAWFDAAFSEFRRETVADDALAKGFAKIIEQHLEGDKRVVDVVEVCEGAPIWKDLFPGAEIRIRSAPSA